MENILEKFTPEMIKIYGISIYKNEVLCLSYPSFIMIYNVKDVTESKDCFKIEADSAAISLWKSTIIVHTTIF